ncbi:MAG: hypothetical protein WBG90_21300 [Saonia sp.]
MKYVFTCFILIVASGFCSFAQDIGATNADLTAVGRNPGLDFIFQQYRNQRNKEVPRANIVGSPYVWEEFKKGPIYSQDGLEGYAYIRYDGYNEEVQLKKYQEDEELQKLLPRLDIYCKVDGQEILFREFSDKKGELKKGHLFKLAEADGITVYQRKAKKYKEGKKGATSLEMTVPDKFVDEFELYVGTGNEKGTISFIKPSKKEILKLFKDEDKTGKVKKFISGSNLDLKDAKDIAQIFMYYNNL